MHYNSIIIGAGPAGLFVAQMLAKNNLKVLLLERNEKAGKKMLISGSGQCNFTHDGDIQDFLKCYGDHGKFLRKGLLSFDNKACMNFFQKQGVASYTMPNGKVFPKSMKSQEVVETLVIGCQKANVELKYNSLVRRINVYDGIFTVETQQGERYFSDHVVIATGGKSYPKTGSDGVGYALAEALGHTIIEPRPALTDVRTIEKDFTVLSGISFQDVSMTVWRENKKVLEQVGDLLFTHKGLSGPLIIDASRWLRPKDVLTINFLHPQSIEVTKLYFSKHLADSGKEELITFLKKLGLPKSFCQFICKNNHLDEHLPCSQITKKARETLVQFITQGSFTVESLGGFHLAMATAGGVHLKEVNPSTMESRKQKGLYCIGELLDIDGNTGGYNIQAAFSTAYLCAEHIIKQK